MVRLSLTDKMRSSVVQENFGVDLLLLIWQESAERNLIRMSPSFGRRLPGDSQISGGIINLPSLGTPKGPPGGAGGFSVVWVSPWTWHPHEMTTDRWKKMDGHLIEEKQTCIWFHPTVK